MNTIFRLTLNTCLTLLLTAVIFAEEGEQWQQFRGPHRNGIASSAGIKTAWSGEAPHQLFRKEIGQGFSGISVAGDAFYTMFATEGDSTEYLVAYSREDAAEKWRYPVGKMFVDQFGNGPRSTVTIDGDRLYALGSTGILHALDRQNGKALWTVSFPEQFEAQVPQRGFSMSPLVDGEQLIIETGGYSERTDSTRILKNHIASFEKKSGKLRWQYDLDPGFAGYSSPFILTFAGVRQYVFVTSRKVFGLSTTGRKLWETDAAPFTVGMPVQVGEDRLFIAAADDAGCKMIRLFRQGDSIAVETLWSNRNMRNHFNSSLYQNGCIFGFNNATLTCLDAGSGEVKWRKRGLGKGSLIATENHLIIISDTGKAVIAEASGEAYREVGSFQALAGKSWTSPTLVDGRLYCRNLTEMTCYDLK